MKMPKKETEQRQAIEMLCTDMLVPQEHLLRRTMRDAEVNVAYRWFLGYGLLDTHAIFTLIRAFFPKLQERPPAFAA